MNKVFILPAIFLLFSNYLISQNVGIGTTNPIENLHVVGNKTLFENNFVGIGSGSPVTGNTAFQIKKNVNTYIGMYIDAGPTGAPFYGFALNGIQKSYTMFSGTEGQLEYHQSSVGVADFLIKGNEKAVFNTGFVGIGTSTPTSAYTDFTIKKNVNDFLGMYIDAGPTGEPFYGYALNGNRNAYTSFSGTAGQFEYHQSSDAIPDFLIKGSEKAVFNTDFVGIGTNVPTSSYAAFTIKKNINSFFGMYIDAGATGAPFYGYGLNGATTAYTTYNGATNQFEYHHTSDALPDFSISNTKASFPNLEVLTVGTNTPFNGFTGLTLKNNTNGFWGMYVDAGTSGSPFYGYAENGTVKAFSQYSAITNNWELVVNTFTALSVDNAGNVGIGTDPVQKLDVNGVIHASSLNGGVTSLSADASGNIIRTPSDARLKQNIAPITGALKDVMKMEGVSYEFIDSKRFGSGRQIGFLAQDLEKIIPASVSDGGEYKSVNYPVLTAVLTEAIKEQQKEIELLMTRVQKLEENQKVR